MEILKVSDRPTFIITSVTLHDNSYWSSPHCLDFNVGMEDKVSLTAPPPHNSTEGHHAQNPGRELYLREQFRPTSIHTICLLGGTVCLGAPLVLLARRLWVGQDLGLNIRNPMPTEVQESLAFGSHHFFSHLL